MVASVALLLAAAAATASRPPPTTAAAALIFGKNPLPPAARLKMPGGTEALRKDCEEATKMAASESFVWEEGAKKGYQVATSLFRAIASSSLGLGGIDSSNDGDSGKIRTAKKQTLWFPSLDDASVPVGLSTVINSNSGRLGGGGVRARASTWPNVPATMVELTWDYDSEPPGTSTEVSAAAAAATAAAAAVEATESWVDGTLGRLGLCPHVRSARRAAVGLDSVGVKEGPVVVRHSLLRSFSPDSSASASETKTWTCTDAATDAALLALAFWNGVSDLATTPETEIATLLIVAPPSYDANFAEFASTCDELLEPAAKAAGADDVIGKAWFHPLYDSSDIGQKSTVLPGHALPAAMVEGFVGRYYGDSDLGSDDGNVGGSIGGTGTISQRQHLPDSATIAKANDAVRHTPHATVNLLRRSQLSAAKVAEAANAAKKPNLVYARNVLRIVAGWKKDK